MAAALTGSDGERPPTAGPVLASVVAADRATIVLELTNPGPDPVTIERFAFSTVCPVAVPDHGDGPLVLEERVSTHHQVACRRPVVVAPGANHRWGPFELGFPPAHANDGPLAGYLILSDGGWRPIETRPPRLDAGPEPDDRTGPTAPDRATGPEPEPGGRVGGATVGAAPCRLDLPDRWRRPLEELTDLLTSLPSPAGRRPRAPGAGAVSVSAGPLPPATAHLVADGETVAVTAADLDGALAGVRAALRGRAGTGTWTVAPAVGWRGLHIDLARQWHPAPLVDRLIDPAAALGLNRLHLHLTDDEGWRLPVPGRSELTEIGGHRGHGLPLPPLLGSGPDRTGGAYSRAEIRSWVAHAERWGVVLVPEIDLPGHCYAALQAVPALRDPDHRPAVASIQHFVGNVLYPGLAATTPFLEDVLGAVTDLFPGPVIHLGGDEVPEGCWDGAPSVAAWSRDRGLTSSSEVERAFLADAAALVRGLGRTPAVWEEGADALEPGSGPVMAWTGHEAVGRLVAAGHQVVACPAAHWYLDLAPDRRWSTRGASWAGHLTEAVAADPRLGVPWDRAGTDLVGAQACLWTEHVPTVEAVEGQLHPRLGLLADALWPVTPAPAA